MSSSSTEADIIIDPSADTIITLKDQGANVAIWDDAAEFPRPPFVLPDTVRDYLTADDTTMKEENDAGGDEVEGGNAESEAKGDEVEGGDTESEAKGENETRFHVSSRHLALASTYFRRDLSDSWDQHDRDEKGRVLLSESGWTRLGFARLMCIIHGRTRAVARTLKLEELAELAHMVDYYDCAEVVEPYTVAWINHLKYTEGVPKSYGMRLVLWLCVAWAFCEEDGFNVLTKEAIYQCRSDMQTMGLPLPEIVTSKSSVTYTKARVLMSSAAIEKRRQEAIGSIITSINLHLNKLIEGKAGCSFACASINLGFFTKAMHVRGLRDPPCTHPYLGISVEMLIRQLRGMEFPQWCIGRAPTAYGNSSCKNHNCTQSRFMTDLATSISGNVKGLRLNDFPSQHNRDGVDLMI